MKIQSIRALILAMALFEGARCFLPTPALTSSRHAANARSTPCLHSSQDDRDNDSSLDDMRRLLEASWNVDTMGSVPTNPEDAADVAATCIQSAADSGDSIFMVDLLLPTYDITQGTNMYDELLAVEFCIALAKSMEEKSCILVRDGLRLQSINRVLEARERSRLDDKEEDGEDEDEVVDGKEEEDDGDNGDATFFDDFAGFDSIFDDETSSSDAGGQETSPSSKDVDSFRQQLMANWDDIPTTDGSDASRIKEQPSKTTEPNEPSPTKPTIASTRDRFYRLASFFGDSKISSGPDMIDQVIKAVAENGMPTDDEETIIILSAVNKNEMVAVRSLVTKYKGSKKIVLVNCKLDPLPRELIRANTVYSILPLVARPVVSEKQQEDNGPMPPKVVVMRRYPKDWEVYVDADGNGFELADVAKAIQVRGKKGPPMEWVGGCVQRYMETKLGGI